MNSSKNIFKEKASDEIKKECKLFIKEYNKTNKNNDVYSRAIKLESRLIESLIESHKEFDNAIEAYFSRGKCFNNEIIKYKYDMDFNNQHFTLLQDKEAHELMHELDIIQENNK